LREKTRCFHPEYGAARRRKHGREAKEAASRDRGEKKEQEESYDR